MRKTSSSGRQWVVNNAFSDPAAWSLPSRIASRCDSLSDSSIERRIQSTTSAAMPPMKKPIRQPQARQRLDVEEAAAAIRRVNCAST